MSAMQQPHPKKPRRDHTLAAETVIPLIENDSSNPVTLFVLNSEDMLEILEQDSHAFAKQAWQVGPLLLSILNQALH